MRSIRDKTVIPVDPSRKRKHPVAREGPLPVTYISQGRLFPHTSTSPRGKRPPTSQHRKDLPPPPPPHSHTQKHTIGKLRGESVKSDHVTEPKSKRAGRESGTLFVGVCGIPKPRPTSRGTAHEWSRSSASETFNAQARSASWRALSCSERSRSGHRHG